MTTCETTMVAIDVAKIYNHALIEFPSGNQKKLKFKNSIDGFTQLKEVIEKEDFPVIAALEPTGNFHRPLGHFLIKQDYDVRQINTIVLARQRDALNNSWNKSDPHDAETMLFLIKNSNLQKYREVFIEGFSGEQEVTRRIRSLTKQRAKKANSIQNHYLAIYFPEMFKFMTKMSISHINLLKSFPTPKDITRVTCEEFIEQGLKLIKYGSNKRGFLKEVYEQSQVSIGVPIEPNGPEVQSFLTTIDEYEYIASQIKKLEKILLERMKLNPQFEILKSIPGIGTTIASTILSEAGDLKRFKHVRQFLKYAGLNLSSSQSGKYQSDKQISKRGNPRLRAVFWQAALVAIYTSGTGNGLKAKYNSIVNRNPNDAHAKRKAITASAIKVATIVHTLIRKNEYYRPYVAGPSS